MTSATALPPKTDLSPGWSLALGILLIVAGFLALLYPVIAAVTATLYLGWFALLAGIVAIAVAIRTRADAHFGWRLAVGVVYLLLGFMLVVNPVAGAASLAMFVGALMAVSGVVEIMLAFRLRPRRGWGWLLANGVLSILLSVLIVIGWPMASLILIGYFVGFQIITCGAARIALSMGARKPAIAAPAR